MDRAAAEDQETARRRAWEVYIEQSREMRNEIEKRQRARRRLARHGIGDAPL